MNCYSLFQQLSNTDKDNSLDVNKRLSFNKGRRSMKSLFSLLLIFTFQSFAADNFEVEAKELAADLKKLLMKNLNEKMEKDGNVNAIPFCHVNAVPILKGVAGDRIKKFEFGRTSHKVRNEKNSSQPWAKIYLTEFQGKLKGEVKKDSIIHRLENGKRIYLEPLYVQAQCLICHGDNIAKDVQAQLKELYPHDKATGFKLNEFRGFIWVKEK